MIIQFLINGLITGILYSLLAVGFALVYNTTRVFHIAAAALYVMAAYAFYFFVNMLELPIVVSAFGAMIVTALGSFIMEVVVYRPLKNRKASLNIAMIASIGIMTVVINLIALIFGNETRVINNVILPTYTLGDIIITTPQIFQMSIGVIGLIAFMLFVKYSNWGLRLRALSADEVLYETLGYKTRHSRTIVFLLSGIFISLASCLTVYDVGLDPHMGMNVLINAMVAMIIGGIGRFNAPILGGLLLGILQSIVVYFFASNWQHAITFLLLLGFLFIRPQGLVGYKQRTI